MMLIGASSIHIAATAAAAHHHHHPHRCATTAPLTRGPAQRTPPNRESVRSFGSSFPPSLSIDNQILLYFFLCFLRDLARIFLRFL
jgi:hypothetical protein